MLTTTLTSRQLSRQTGKAKQAAQRGPVVITERGHPTHALLTIKEYRALMGPITLLDAIAQPTARNVDFKSAHLRHGLFKPANLV